MSGQKDVTDLIRERDKLLAVRRALEAVERAAKLRRNTRIRDQRAFEGTWVAVPAEDFDALCEALVALDAARDAVLKPHFLPHLHRDRQNDPTCLGCLRETFDAVVERWMP